MRPFTISKSHPLEYLLTECVKQREKNGKYVSDDIDAPLEIDLLEDTSEASSR